MMRQDTDADGRLSFGEMAAFVQMREAKLREVFAKAMSFGLSCVTPEFASEWLGG